MGRIGTGIGSVRLPRDPTEIANLQVIWGSEVPSEDAEQSFQGVEVAVHHALFEGNNCVFGDRNRLGTYLPATSRDVAVTDIVVVPQIADAVLSIERMHFERGRIDE